MSATILIKDGIIVDPSIATFSYQDPGVIRITPITSAQEEKIIRLSENNKRIKALRAEVDELKKELADTDCAIRLEEFLGQASNSPSEEWAELEAEWNSARASLSDDIGALEIEAIRILNRARALRREVLQRELERQNRVNSALELTAVLRRDADKLTSLLFHVHLTEGTKAVDAQVDGRTAGQLKRIQQRIEKIDEDLAKEDADVSEELQKELKDISLELQELPEKARTVFTAELWRQEQAQNVCEQLLRSGWRLQQKFVDGGFFDDVSFAFTNDTGDLAMLSFTIEGEVRIDNRFSGPGGEARREALKQAVLGALIKGGATAPRSKCLDEEPEEAQVPAQVRPALQPEKAPELRRKQMSDQKQVRRSGVKGERG